jgi:hypothetical protein
MQSSLEPISNPELNLLMVASANERNPVLFRTAFREISEQCSEAEFKRFLALINRALPSETQAWIFEQFAMVLGGNDGQPT